MHFIINSEIESHKSLAQFVQEIGTIDLKERYPDTEELIRKFSVSVMYQEEEKKEGEMSQVNNIIAILRQENESRE